MRCVTYSAAVILPLIAFGAGTASAADLSYPYPAQPVAPSPYYAAAPASNWSGFYLGVNGGWGWAQSTSNTAYNGGFSGGVLGVDAGYNVQISNHIVLGVEGDLAWSGQGGTINSSAPTITQSLDWIGTFRGRIGVPLNNWMPYVTAGLAAGGGTRTTSIGSQSDGSTHTGYVLGAGVEWAFAQNWTAKLEYQYINLGSSTYSFSSPVPSPNVAIHDSIVKVGLNYKF